MTLSTTADRPNGEIREFVHGAANGGSEPIVLKKSDFAKIGRKIDHREPVEKLGQGFGQNIGLEM